MADVKLGSKTYKNVSYVKMDTLDGGTAMFKSSDQAPTNMNIMHSARGYTLPVGTATIAQIHAMAVSVTGQVTTQ